MCIDDDEIFFGTFVVAFQRIFALSSKPYSILIMPSISALKALDKALDEGPRDIGSSPALEFEDNPLRYEKNLHLPSTKLEDSFHVNKKIFEVSMKQS
jgi:hypothetical protein